MRDSWALSPESLLKSIVELHNVSIELQGKVVLSSINFLIEPGQNWAVVGPNGSGKTTLLRVINGYLRPSSGSVKVMGEEFGQVDLRELRIKIGFVSSYMGELISLDDNVLDIVVAGRDSATKLWAIPPSEDVMRASKLLKTMNCSRYEDSILRDLSQGERQKIFIARALMTDPSLLVLDEPCAGLDIKSRESFLSTVSKIGRNRKISMLYVTHRIDEIPACFTHALLLKKGKMLSSGRINSVLRDVNLSRCFEVEIRVKKEGGRYFAIVT